MIRGFLKIATAWERLSARGKRENSDSETPLVTMKTTGETPVPQFCHGLLLSQIIEGHSLRQIIIRIDHSNYLRHFARIFNGPMIDFTTLCKLKNQISNRSREPCWSVAQHLGPGGAEASSHG